MSLGLTLLLNAANAALDQLWHSRMERDAAVVVPDYLDPGLLPPLESAPPAAEERVRAHLLRIGAQMRGVGLAAVAEAVLQARLAGRRQAALLALAGSGDWAAVPGHPALRQRAAADGSIYLLDSRAAGGASHAPHAMLEQEQRLWVLPAPTASCPATPPALERLSAPDCLSVEAALRDVVLALQAEGEATLAADVASLAGAESLSWAVPAPLPAAALAPAAA
ncbi:hypothetical protein NON00_08295 [Roseomonas sp. GC11]|uniref:hypothetical protein n=1 Tax=Roseomonas sp. GC11 TaxID=2950546 RepID=UPI0021086115|nr:hypothetical protein [Roseomonas sp. GC11]MCQ4159928.1 hypothetical protein [Roseomonas sp. GC11]